MEVKHKIIIRGTMFEIDHSNSAFICSNEPENRINFNELIKDKNDFFLYYDLGKTTSVKDPMFDGEFAVIHIPREILQPPKNQNNTYPERINHACYKNKWGIVLVDENIQYRLDGNLPKISIYDTDYEIDIVNNKLKSIDKKYPDLSMDKMAIYKHHFVFCLDPKSKQIIDQKNFTPVPQEGSLLVTIPLTPTLDCVGFAQWFRTAETIFISTVPVKMRHKALTEPLTSTKHIEQLKILVEKTRLQAKNRHKIKRNKSHRIG